MSTGSELQIPLVKPEPPGSLPVGLGHYVPVVQTKAGEREALRRAPENTWERMMPVVELLGPKTKKPLMRREWPRSWVDKLSKSLGNHPFYFDILRLSASQPVEASPNPEPILPLLYRHARSRGLVFVPVVHVDQSGGQHVHYVADAALQDGRGVALRYRIRSAISTAGKRRQDILADQLAALGVDVTDADLLVDLHYLDADVEVEAEDIADMLRDVCSVGKWRCLVLLGTSIPKTLAEVKQGTVGAIPRREWALWTALRASDTPRMPTFGDYAIQHPDPPAEDIGGNSMRANLRYTTADETVVARGNGPFNQEGSDQYHDLCALIAGDPRFKGAQYSWGDGEILSCAQLMREPGSQGAWRGAGTSHHLQLVTDQLRALAP